MAEINFFRGTVQQVPPHHLPLSLRHHSSLSTHTKCAMAAFGARGAGYGLDAELARQREAKYDYEAEDTARVSHESNPFPLSAELVSITFWFLGLRPGCRGQKRLAWAGSTRVFFFAVSARLGYAASLSAWLLRLDLILSDSFVRWRREERERGENLRISTCYVAQHGGGRWNSHGSLRCSLFCPSLWSRLDDKGVTAMVYLDRAWSLSNSSGIVAALLWIYFFVWRK